MGHTESKERSLFIDIVKHMLIKRGIQVSSKQLREFFHFVQECSPWFPEEGTLNLETWKKLGKEMKLYYTLYGPERVPVDAFSLWNLLRDSFDPTHEAVCLARKTEEDLPLSSVVKKTRSYTSINNTEPAKATVMAVQKNDDTENEVLDPGGEQELEDEAAKYNKDDDYNTFGSVEAFAAPPPTAPPSYQ